MGDRKNIRFEKPQLDATEQMVKDGLVDDQSEAVRTALNAGLTQLGYLNGGELRTPLRAGAERFADALSLTGLFILAVNWLVPLGFVMYAFAAFFAAGALYALNRVLAAYEPAISRRLMAALDVRPGGEKT